MARFGWLGRCLLCAEVMMLVSGCGGGSEVLAADTESRDFTIFIDGKHAGQYHMTIHHGDDGTETMTGQADVRVSYLVYTYRYNYQGTEVWKDGRLIRLTSESNDNGKRFSVHASADPAGLRVRVNGAEHTTRPDVWTTTYWHLADARFRNQGVPLMDADTGKNINATLQYVGTAAINVGGQAENCTHYRITGGVQVEAWYDAHERLVRQESIEDGHKTLLDLTSVRR